MMAVADSQVSLVLTGTGDVLGPEDGVIGIGSGGSVALAAARGLLPVDGFDAETVARRAMAIAADICVYTNTNVVIESLESTTRPPSAPARTPPNTTATSSARTTPSVPSP